MSNRFYTADPLGPGEYVLAGPEAHHLAAVRRVQPGDRIALFNGDGCDYPAEVVGVDRKQIVLQLHEPIRIERELPFALVVASALPKGDRADVLIEKLTELGATRFVPLITERSVVVPKSNAAEKFARAVIEASKQCGRNRLMAVDPPQRWRECLRRNDWPSIRYVLHVMPSPPGAATEFALATTRCDVAVAVGPEGGFTEEELSAATSAGWTAASLGPRVLRVETAALAAAARLAIQ